MRRLLLPLAAFGIAVAIPFIPIGIRPAYACTPDPGFDAVRDSDVIVAGRITGWNVAKMEPLALKPGTETVYTADISVKMTVDAVFKGSAPSQTLFLNGTSLSFHNDQHDWGFTSCAIFDADPTGQYVIVGLYMQDDGALRAHPLLFFSGDNPEGERYDLALDRLSSLGPAALPTGGGEPPSWGSQAPALWVSIAGGSALAIGALAAASAYLLRTRRRPSP